MYCQSPAHPRSTDSSSSVRNSLPPAQLELTITDKSGSRKNSIAINAKHTWWSFISTDAGLLHATLATWALYGMLVKGPSDLHVQQLRHKNEAIKEINMKLARPESEITDELIGTVVTMASFEVCPPTSHPIESVFV
jgi:hypothetical protein